MTKNRYQSCYSDEVNKELILKKCPWLTDYEFLVYDINDGRDWTFIKQEKALFMRAFFCLFKTHIYIIHKTILKRRKI